MRGQSSNPLELTDLIVRQVCARNLKFTLSFPLVLVNVITLTEFSMLPFLIKEDGLTCRKCKRFKSHDAKGNNGAHEKLCLVNYHIKLEICRQVSREGKTTKLRFFAKTSNFSRTNSKLFSRTNFVLSLLYSSFFFQPSILLSVTCFDLFLEERLFQ